MGENTVLVDGQIGSNRISTGSRNNEMCPLFQGKEIADLNAQFTLLSVPDLIDKIGKFCLFWRQQCAGSAIHGAKRGTAGQLLRFVVVFP